MNLSSAIFKLKRLALFVGYLCSNDCKFCVVADKRAYKDKSTLDIKRELKEAYLQGSREVVLTGGECTIRDDIFEIVKFARSLGYLIIQLQTNGRIFSSQNFVKKILFAGMNEFAPALHGNTANLHDFLTGRHGSFRQTVLGIYNVRKISKGKIRILTNTVINKYNYKFLPEIAALLIKLGVKQYQFAFVHALGNAKKNFKEIVPRKTDVIPYLRLGLELGASRQLRVMAEAVPLCLMQGLERYCSEFYIPFTEVRERGYTISDFGKVRITEGKTKFKKCQLCKYFNICEGPWKEYPQFYGDSEFNPVS